MKHKWTSRKESKNLGILDLCEVCGLINSHKYLEKDPNVQAFTTLHTTLETNPFSLIRREASSSVFPIISLIKSFAFIAAIIGQLAPCGLPRFLEQYRHFPLLIFCIHYSFGVHSQVQEWIDTVNFVFNYIGLNVDETDLKLMLYWSWS